MAREISLDDGKSYIENFFWVIDKNSHLVPMKLFPTQEYYITNRTHRDIVLKARQVMISTAVLADNARMIFTRKYQRMAVVAHDNETSEFLLMTVQRFHDHLPAEIKPEMQWKSATRKYFPTIDSYIYVDSASSDAIGIGHTLSHAHLSEIARWMPTRAKDLFVGISETVPKDGYITIESTPTSRGGLFYDLYTDAKRGANEYKAFFFPWWWNPEYKMDEIVELKNDEMLYEVAKVVGLSTQKVIEQENEMMTVYKLSPMQIAWRRKKVATLKEMFFRDYPENELDCLLPTSLVVLPGGKTKTIRELVANKYNGSVLSIDNYGNLVERKVIGWHKSPRRGRKLYRLSFCHAKGSWVGHKAGCVITEDHKVLTGRGWVEAKDVREDDLIATGTPYPNTRTEQLILGTLMGDGCICNRKLSLSQSNHEWAKLKAQLLQPFGAKVFTTSHNHLALRTKRYPYFDYLREEFYPNGIKDISKNLVAKLNDFGIAVWFLDDGNTRIRETGRPLSEIACGILPEATVAWLCQWLSAKGYECKPLHHNRKYMKIQFTADGTEKLLKAIAKYVPESMRYKLPLGLDAFEAEWYQPEVPATFWDKVQIKEILVPMQQHKYDKFASLYCIDVEETHNFVTLGGVVHNCWLSNEMAAVPGIYLKPYYLKVRDGKTDGNLTVWKDVIGGHKYTIGVDTASGSARDYSAASVIDNKNLEYVARIRGKIHPDLFAEEVYRLGKRYNDAMIAVEREEHGRSVLKILLDNQYPNIYYHSNYNEILKTNITDAGWVTSKTTRMPMLNNLVALIRSQNLESYSENLLYEASNLIWENGVDTKLRSDKNDDEFVAVAIALQVREANPVLEDEGKRLPVRSYARVF